MASSGQDSIRGEKPPFIRYYPDEMNGYIVFDRSEFPSLESWVCVVREIYYAGADTVPRDSIFAVHHTYTDYLLLLKEVTSEVLCKYVVDIRGYDEDDEILTSVGDIVPLHDYIGTLPYGYMVEFIEKTTCNGKAYHGWLFPYAWDICAWEAKSFLYGTSGTYGAWLDMRPGTYKAANGESTNFWAYYEVNNFFSWCTAPECNPNNNQADIKYFSQSEGSYKDIQGHTLNGAITGVKKKAGPWGQSGGLRAPSNFPPPLQSKYLNLSAPSYLN